ncbi:glycosyltransferase family 4 protein [Methylomonas sp. AM2-LC]|uniref:glycosyltransferase family 4 protein n=1 Tax=Methylomonas sp. AM2-LC TaxID=3153301 RepID=UPI003267680F
MTKLSNCIKTVIVTNVPAPYRVPVWQRVAQTDGIDLELIFCAPAHIDTTTKPTEYGFKLHFLTGRYLAMQRRFMHWDTDVWSLLTQLQPDVIITTGYIPTFLFAFAWSLQKGVPHIAMTDGTANSEKTLTFVHRLLRKFVLRRSESFIGACLGSTTLFKQYGVSQQRIHLSCLCADNAKFKLPPINKSTDFIFCGRLLAHKHPQFALQVAQQVALRLGRKVSIDYVGSGQLETQLRSYAAEISAQVDCRFLGYVTQAELPACYANAKVFLFPSEWDPWGVVANEACAAGLPVIVSPHPGSVTELLVDGINAFVRDLDVEQWTLAAISLLTNQELYDQFSQNSRSQVANYNYDNSAQGMIEAIKQAAEQKT